MTTPATFVRLALSIGAGLAAALLFVVPLKGTTLAIILAYFAALPLIIAGLGWGQLTALAASVFGAGALALALHPVIGLIFLIGLALPAWWLCNMTLRGAQAKGARWHTLGEIVMWAAGLSAGTAFAAVAAMSFSYGGYERALDEISQRIAPLIENLRQALNQRAPDAGFDGAELARGLVALAPAALAASSLLMLLINLYLGARIVEMSHRLPRVWAPVPENLILPARAAAVLGAALLLSALPGMAGVLAMAGAAAAGLALSLHGLAFIHCASRGQAWRGPMLVALYAVSLVITPLPLALALFIALADILVTLRRRRAASPSPRT